MNRLILLIVNLLPIACYSQYDSTYAVKYDKQIGVGIYQSKPSYGIKIQQKNIAGVHSEINYQTLANYITGITVHYDKLSLFAGLKTPGDVAQQARKGKTKSSQFNLAFTGIKLRIEASLRFYKGFYDNNSPLYIPDFTDSTNYFQNKDMRTNSLKLKVFYFLNPKKRFSYGAAYINNVRQIRSAGSFIMTAHLYNFQLKSIDPLIPPELETYYSTWKELYNFKVTSISGGIGYTHTFAIFKRIFLNFLLTVGAEGNHVRLSDGNKEFSNWRTTLSAYDLRSSLGYNSKKFFLSFISIVEGNNYVLPDLTLSNAYLNNIFIIGFRFGIKKPLFSEKMQ